MNKHLYGCVGLKTRVGLVLLRRAVIAMGLLFPAFPAKAGFPLSTEDSGTLGSGRSKVELNAEWAQDREQGERQQTRAIELALVHGFSHTLNGFLVIPHRDVRSEAAAGDNAHLQGGGDLKAGVKWRYFDQGGLSLGIKAGLTKATGDDSKQLGNGKATQFLNLITTYEKGAWELDFDFAYKHNANRVGQRTALWSTSVAFVRTLNSRWKIMGDIGAASNSHPQRGAIPVYLGLGLSYAMARDLELNLGLKHALNAAETDSSGLAGVSWYF